jgi:amino-acid N-acetyltransferase
MKAFIRSADTADHQGVCDLLASARLPLDGLPGDMAHFLVAEDAGRIVAAAGLEVYGGAALLRSVVVAPSHRGTGLGGQLSDRALSMARDLGIHDVYLLTDTAEGFFHRRGFAVVSRADVPRSVQASVEFATACPASATVMHRGVPPR